jgi:Fe-S cluster assembly ATP-binding protein
VLSQVILGNPKYKVIKGKILFEGRNIMKFPSEKRVGLGISLSWQNPPAIKGVKLNQLLAKIAKKKYFQIKEADNLLDREVNVDFSGGEKKVSELLQILSLNPKLVIFDEIDSGLDIKKLQVVSKIIKKELLSGKTSILLITHSGEILNFFKPDITNVMVDGKIYCKSNDYKKILKSIKRYGFEKCKKCKLFAD